MRDWQSEIERSLQKALEEANQRKLPGSGKPLNLDNDPYTPSDLRMAHKLLKDNDLQPAWMLESQEIDTLREKLIRRLRKTAGVDDVPQILRDEITAFNKRLIGFNLKLPAGIPHKRHILIERELAKR